uniref:AAA+ ATPase domain-containing protein n=1 Tax=viral metagenome TaxID=1070528 RepID=A0A6C0CJG2_9ZZZZ
MQWVDKYKPIKEKDFVGNKAQLQECIEWIKTYKKHKQPLLIQGPIGCGKTVLAHFLLNEYGYDPEEMSTSTSRSKDNVLRFFNNSSGSIKSLNRLFDDASKRKQLAYIFDDIDCMDNVYDKGGIPTILEVVNGKNKRARIYKKSPIILTCNQVYKKKIALICKYCKHVVLKSPTEMDQMQLINRIADAESLRLSQKTKDDLINVCKGDLRQLVISLNYSIPRTPSAESNLQRKDYTLSVSESVNEMFHKKDIHYLANLASCDSTIYFHIQENYIRNIKDIHNIAYSADNLSQGNVMTLHIFNQNRWDLYGIFNVICCAIPCIKSDQTSLKTVKYKFPVILSSMSGVAAIRNSFREVYRNTGIKDKDTLIHIAKKIYGWCSKGDFEKASDFMQSYGLEVQHLEKCLKIISYNPEVKQFKINAAFRKSLNSFFDD